MPRRTAVLHLLRRGALDEGSLVSLVRSCVARLGVVAGVALDFALGGAAHAAGIATRVSHILDVAEHGLDASLSCGAGEALGGGFDGGSDDGLVAIATGPALAFDPLALADRWQVSVHNRTAGAQSLRAAAICGALPGVAYLAEAFSVAASSLVAGAVACPAGTFAVSGGVWASDGDTLGDARLASLAPRFAGATQPLAARADGENDAPDGWEAALESASAAGGATVYAVCAAPDAALAMVASGDVAPDATAVATIACPSGTIALAGGADASDRHGLRIVSNGPAFAGSPALRLFDHDAGDVSAPPAWRVAVRNESDAAKPYKVVAVCVPEADAGAAAIAATALAAISGRARRRRAAGTTLRRTPAPCAPR
jgi:hypothetical protein